MLDDGNLPSSLTYGIFHSEVKDTMSVSLSYCREGDRVKIKKISGNGGFKKRLLDMGFRKGKELTVIRYAPLKDPMEVTIGDCNISLRVEEAKHIEVEHTQN